MTTRKVYQEIALKIAARINCEKSGNSEWWMKHDSALDDIENNHLPSGSGIDSGCTIMRSKSTMEKIVICSAYHRMTEGMYDGWINFKVVLTPSFVSGLNVRIVNAPQDLRDYLSDLFYESLTAEMEQ